MVKNNESKKDTKETLPKGIVEVKLRWESDEDLETIYVNHLRVTHAGPEFYLIFGELPMPVILGEEEAPSELVVYPKVRLAISPKQIKSIAEVLYKNVQSYLEREN
jgi:hypothetical protein